MRRNWSIIILTLCCCLCVACQLKEAPIGKTRENPSPTTPSEVMTKSDQKMKMFEGHRWKIQGEQWDPKQKKRLYQFDIAMNYHDENNYYAKRIPRDQESNSTHYELYAQKPYLYVLMFKSRHRQKFRPATSFAHDAYLSFDRKWSDPKYVFSLVQKNKTQSK